MKRTLVLLGICGTLAMASCAKHACPAYGSTQKAVNTPAQVVKA